MDCKGEKRIIAGLEDLVSSFLLLADVGPVHPGGTPRIVWFTLSQGIP